jgi:hypothetical protein
MKIKPVSTWQNGQEVLATDFTMTSSYDNLKDHATFNFFLNKIIEDGTKEVLVNGTLNINEQDYIDWSSATDVNEWAFIWAATKLNLQFEPEEII